MVKNPARGQAEKLEEIYSILDKRIKGCNNLCLERKSPSKIYLSYFNNNGVKGYEGIIISPATENKLHLGYSGLVEIADETFKSKEKGNPQTPFSQMKEQLSSQARNNSDWAFLDVVANYNETKIFLNLLCRIMKEKEKKEKEKKEKRGQ